MLPDSFRPDKFPIPQFRAATEKCLREKVLTDKDRKYVVQTMATMLMTYVSRPSMKDCNVVALSLVKKFPFLRDDEGEDGQVN